MFPSSVESNGVAVAALSVLQL